MNASLNDSALIQCPDCKLRYAVVTESCGMVEVLKDAPCPHCAPDKAEGMTSHTDSLEREIREEMDTNTNLRFALKSARDKMSEALRDISNAL
jgi:hypothetical protein